MPSEPTEEGDSTLAVWGTKGTIQHLAAIGSVAGTWAIFETFLDSLALELAEITSEAGLCFTAQIAGSGRKLDAYVAVAKFRGAKKVSGLLDDFSKDTVRLAEQRNRAIHDPWLIEEGQIPQRLEITAKKKLRSEMVPVSTDDLIALDKWIMEHVQRFLDLDAKVRVEIGASPETPP